MNYKYSVFVSGFELFENCPDFKYFKEYGILKDNIKKQIEYFEEIKKNHKLPEDSRYLDFYNSRDRDGIEVVFETDIEIKDAKPLEILMT